MSIKILHTSDWHLGKTFRATNFDLIDIQRKVLIELLDIINEQKPQIVLIAGDIFDTYNPPFEAERLFYETITKISDSNSLVIVVAGNHDSPDKLQISRPLIYGKYPIVISGAPSDYLQRFNFENEVFQITSEDDFLKVKMNDENAIVSIRAIPYLSEVRMGLAGDIFKNSLNDFISKEPQFTCDNFIVLSHLFVSGATKSSSERVLQIGGMEFIPLEVLPKSADYIALGHLHRHQYINNAVYSGSIYPFDVGEIADKKGVCIWENGETRFLEFKNIPKIKRVEYENLNEAIKNLPPDDCFYYVFIKSNHDYSHENLNELIKTFGDRLISWQFEVPLYTNKENNLDINTLTDDALFKEFYKSKCNGQEPSEDIVNLFHDCLEEVKNVAN